MRLMKKELDVDNYMTIVDVVDETMKLIENVPLPYAVLIQLSGGLLPGFLGFETNTISVMANASTGGTTTTTGTGATITSTPEEGPVPNGTNFNRYTITTAPFKNTSGVQAGAGYPVNWYIMSGSTYYATTRSTVTDTNGTATIVITEGTIDTGISYTIVAECTFSAVPLDIDTQQISFLPTT